MRIGIVLENKSNYPFQPGDPPESDSELFSNEEEDALISGLRDAGHDVVRVGDGGNLVRRVGHWRKRCDVVFNLSVGYRGMDRKSYAPGVLSLAGIPYIGSDAYALSLTRHKQHAKLVVAAVGVPTALSALWIDEDSTAALASLDYPVIVKPVAESSSIGIGKDSVVHTPAAAAARAATIVARYNQPALVEAFIRGTEVEVPLIGWPHLTALGVVGISVNGAPVRGDAYLAADAVYSDQYGFTVNPPELDCDRIAAVAVVAARTLGIRDYGRIDFRVTDDGTPMFMEASTHPHLQPHSSFYALAQAAGRSYPEMLDSIVRVGIVRLGL